jgi:hypothetical protein
VIAAKAVSFHEALMPEFRVYQEQVVKNESEASLKRNSKVYKIVDNNKIEIYINTPFLCFGKGCSNPVTKVQKIRRKRRYAKNFNWSKKTKSTGHHGQSGWLNNGEGKYKSQRGLRGI